KTHQRTLGRGGAISAPAAVRLANRGPEPDVARDRVEHEVPIPGSASRERVDVLPRDPMALTACADLERVAVAELQYGPVLQPEVGPGQSRANADHLLVNGRGVARGDRGTDDSSGNGRDFRCRFVARFCAGARDVQPAAQPVQRLARNPGSAGLRRDLESDL